MHVIGSLSESNALNIRRATVEDMPTVARLAVQLARQHNAYDGLRFDLKSFEPLEESHAEYLTEQFHNERSTFLLAESKGEIIGYAFLRKEPQDLLGLLAEGVWLHDIYFKESVRGQGIGESFFEALIKEAMNLGSSFLMLGVSPHNTTAQKFFTKIGFRPTMQEMRMDFE